MSDTADVVATEPVATEQESAAVVDEPQSKKRKLEEVASESSGEPVDASENGEPAAENGENAEKTEDAEMADAPAESAESADADKEAEEAKEEEDESFEEYVETDDEETEITIEQVNKLLKNASNSALLALAEKLVADNLKSEAVAEFCKSAEKAQESTKCKVFVRALPFDLKETLFKKAFNNFGKVIEAIIIKDRGTMRSKGFGFVTFSKNKYAEKAVKAGTVKIGTREVQCSHAHPKSSQRPAPRPMYYQQPQYNAYNRGPYAY